MMEKRNNPAGEPCRDWKDTLGDVLWLFVLVLLGVTIGIALCKFCPGVWAFVNWGMSV